MYTIEINVIVFGPLNIVQLVTITVITQFQFSVVTFLHFIKSGKQVIMIDLSGLRFLQQCG